MISVRYQKTYLKHKLKIGILLYTKGTIQRTSGHICLNLDNTHYNSYSDATIEQTLKITHPCSMFSLGLF